MKPWIEHYLAAQHRAVDSIPVDTVTRVLDLLRQAVFEDRQIFCIGNGGNASNASHFATDLGKSASDAIGRRIRVLSLTDNVPWITALANDYAYEDIFVGQLQNYARPGDVLIGVSVSGNSPNLVKAFEWAIGHGVQTIALVGARRGRMAELANELIVIDDTHYGRVEDAQMHVLLMLCYAFVEKPDHEMTKAH
ncbi:MAG: SIS domain-containing protein [Verrucomicrobiota bacterium]|nr:SIS domain-containing protein [Verrucomicrobiota bacterium]